ncbi:SH2 domain-containing protein [European chub iridovirus]|nr:SH2 domain-containing protein [European chub iridovirus]
MQWKIIVDQFAVFEEYACLWHGKLSEDQVRRMLDLEHVDTLIIYDRTDINYPHIFSLAVKTSTGIRLEDVFANAYKIATFITGSLHAESNLQDMMMWLVQRYVVLSPYDNTFVCTSFYKRICTEYEMLVNELPLGFFCGDIQTLQEELDHAENALVVASGPVEFMQLARFVVSRSTTTYILYWDFDRMFKVASNNNDLFECCSIKEALKQFINSQKVILYDAFNLQRLAFRALKR